MKTNRPKRLPTSSPETPGAAAELVPLAYDLTLDANLRAQLLINLAELDRLNTMMVVIGRQMLDTIRELSLGIPAADVEAARKAVIEDQRQIRGGCVAALPLDLGGAA